MIPGRPVLLLDTSVLIGLPELDLPDEPTALSAISYAELGLGIERATDPQHRRSRIARRTWYSEVFDTPWLPLDTAAADGYAYLASIVAKSRPAHARSKDIMLAGQAYALSARLATLNPKDFALVAEHVEIVVPRLRN